LDQRLNDRSFEIVGFPCNQFMGQCPGTPEDIRKVCNKFEVEFKVAEMVCVNGPERHPLYKLLIGDGRDITWNFYTKFICVFVGHEIEIHRYDGMHSPLSLEEDIVELLQTIES